MKSLAPFKFPALIFVLALSVRLFYLAEISHSPFFSYPMIDAETYFQTAQVVAGGDLLAGHIAFWQPPLYPYLLGLAVAVFGENHYRLHLLHFILGAFNCVLIYWLGRRAFSEGVAKAAALIACAYGPFLYFEGEYLPPVLLVFLTLLLLLALFRAGEQVRPRTWFWPGLLLGLSAVARPDVLLFLPLALGWLIASFRRQQEVGVTGRSPLRWLAGSALFFVGLLLPIAPVAFRNWQVERVAVPISTNGGLNFYIGNNPDYDRVVAIRPGYAWVSLNQVPFLNKVASTAEQSNYFYRKSWNWIESAPGDWLRLLARKTGMYWNGHEFVRNLNFYAFRQYSRLLSALLWEHGLFFPFGLVSPLALLGLVLILRKPRTRTGLLILFTLASSASVILFFIASRYRMPLVPVLLLFAVQAAGELWRQARQRQWRSLIPELIALAGLLFWLNQGNYRQQEYNPAEENYWLARVALKQGDFAQTRQYLIQALRLDPNHLEARMQMGFLSLATGDLSEAEADFQAVLALQDQAPILARAAAHQSLGQVYALTKQYRRSEEEYRAAISISPGYTDARVALAKVLLEQGRLDDAETELRRAVQFGPWSADAHYGMGLVANWRGRPRAAIPWFLETTRIDPAYFDAYLALADTYWKLGETKSAREEIEWALKLGPKNAEALALRDKILGAKP
jgi:tetratricopeptide (TPR) repeat protein